MPDFEYLPPMTNARAAVEKTFPGARVTSGTRHADDPLSRANPNSYHIDTDWAVDVAPIPGIKYEDFLNTIKQSGYDIVQERDEQTNPTAWTTGPNWHVVLAGGPAEAKTENFEYL